MKAGKFSNDNKMNKHFELKRHTKTKTERKRYIDRSTEIQMMRESVRAAFTCVPSLPTTIQNHFKNPNESLDINKPTNKKNTIFKYYICILYAQHRAYSIN